MHSASTTHRSATLAELAKICQAGRVNYRALTQATAYSALDQVLPGGGWPLGALTEIIPSAIGIGELRLLAPALAAITRAARYVAFIDPPHLPYPPALAQHGLKLERVLLLQKQSNELSLWAAEQMLRCPAVGAVLAWVAVSNDKNLRRLQLAAEAGGTLAVLYRSRAAAAAPSPAALRLSLHATVNDLQIEILKCRGGRAGKIVHCTFDSSQAA